MNSPLARRGQTTYPGPLWWSIGQQLLSSKVSFNGPDETGRGRRRVRSPWRGHSLEGGCPSSASAFPAHDGLASCFGGSCGPSCFGQGSFFFKQPQKLSHISTLVYTDDDEEEEQTTSELLAEKLENFKSANVALTDNQNVDCLLALHVTLNGLNVHVLAKIYRLSRRRTLGSGTPGRPISRYSGGLDSSTACYGGRGE